MENLPTLLTAIDTVLSLHYASSITVARLHDLCTKATALTHRRVDKSTFELLLAIDQNLFRVISPGTASDYGIEAPQDLSPTQYGSMIPLRRRDFEQKLEAAVAHWGADGPPPVLLRDLAIEDCSSPSKKTSASRESIKPRSALTSPCKVAKADLSNKKPRFTLKNVPKVGPSLLERIRSKEMEKKAYADSNPAEKTQLTYIRAKMPAIYNVIYELCSSSRKTFDSFALLQIVSMVKDSLSYNISEDEVLSALHQLQLTLPDRVELIQRGELKALKVFTLNRAEDLPKLEKA